MTPIRTPTIVRRVSRTMSAAIVAHAGTATFRTSPTTRTEKGITITMHKRDYVITARFLVAGEGWKSTPRRVVDSTMQQAWEIASEIAHDLDAAYGDSHFWSVTLTGETGDIVQLFHGRLV